MSKYLGLYLLHKDTVVIDLSTMQNKLPEKWQDPFYNRILYIVGSKTNQKDCY